MSQFIGKGMESQARALTSDEQQLVRWLLSHGEEQCHRLVQQVERLTVRGRCRCGCPTVYFALDGTPILRKGERLISDHCATVDGMEVGVMLFENDGAISSLEVYSAPGTDKPFGLPNLDDMVVVPPAE